MDWRQQLAWLLQRRWAGHGGLNQAASELGVSRMTLWQWRAEVVEPNWENRRKLTALVRQTKEDAK